MSGAKRRARTAARAATRATRLSTSVREPESKSPQSAVNMPTSGGAETRRLDGQHPFLRATATNDDAPAAKTSAAGEVKLAPVASAIGQSNNQASARQRDWIANAVRLGVGGLFLWAGVSKAANGVAFLAALNAYELPLPRVVLASVAITLPWVEILSGLLLATRTRVAPALLLSLLMTLAFCVATGQAVVRGLDISCGCLDLDFLSATPWPQAQKILESVGAAFLRNLAMLLGIVFLLGRLEHSGTVSGPRSGPRLWLRPSASQPS